MDATVMGCGKGELGGHHLHVLNCVTMIDLFNSTLFVAV
jgi:hypothetical protein